MPFNTCVHCFVPCSHNIHPVSIPKDVMVCIHLGVHYHHVSNGTCHESLKMAYRCVANEVMTTYTAINFAIVMIASKQFLVIYF